MTQQKCVYSTKFFFTKALFKPSFALIYIYMCVCVWANFALCSNCMGGGQAQYYPHSYK